MEPAALVKRSRNSEVIEVRWEDLTRVKEEFFPNGKRISITVYRKPATPQQKTKAWAVYRDDVTDIDSIRSAVARAETEVGSIDILVNNSGVSTTQRIQDVSEEDWDYMFDTNTKGSFTLATMVSCYGISSFRFFVGNPPLFQALRPPAIERTFL